MVRPGQPRYPVFADIRNDIAFVIDADWGPKSSHQTTGASATKQFVATRNLWPLLCHNDLDLRALVGQATGRPTALFITYPDELPAVYPLVATLVGQVYQAALEVARAHKARGQAERLERKLQLFIDEFGVLPALPQFENWVSIARARNIQIIIAYQSEAQLDIHYRAARRVIEDGFGATLVLGVANEQTAERFSRIIGDRERAKESKSYGRRSHQFVSKNVSTQRERIMSPEALLRLPRHQYLLLLQNSKPALLTKHLVHQVFARLLRRAGPMPPPLAAPPFDLAAVIHQFHGPPAAQVSPPPRRGPRGVIANSRRRIATQ